MLFFVADLIFGCKGTVIPLNKIEEFGQIWKFLLQACNISLFFHNLNDFYHILLFVQLLFFCIICFPAAKLQFFFHTVIIILVYIVFSLRKVRSAAGAATPVYAENAVCAHFSIRTNYARCGNCANDSGVTIPHKGAIQP